ncbi:MAG TPA: hypothetical protein VGC45_07080 [Gryllotalpicola sp.]
MPDTNNPLLPSSPFDVVSVLFPIVVAVMALGIVVVFAIVVYRLVRDRKKVAASRDAMYRLPGAILQATEKGDLAKAQLLQNQLLLMQRQDRSIRPVGLAVGPGAGPTGVPGDVNGDGIPGS